MDRPFRQTWEQFTLLAVARTVLDGRTLLIGFAGGWLANAGGLPAGWLSGAMTAVTIAAVWGMNVHISPRLTDAVFVVLGALLGAGVTPEIVDRVGSWPISLAGLLVGVFVLVIAVQAYLVRVAGWDRTTAFSPPFPARSPMSSRWRAPPAPTFAASPSAKASDSSCWLPSSRLWSRRSKRCRPSPLFAP